MKNKKKIKEKKAYKVNEGIEKKRLRSSREKKINEKMEYI